MSYPLRAVYDNSAERATISVTGAAVLPVANLHTNNKNEVWRSASTVLSVTFTATYFSPETIGVVAFPYCNFSNSATMRVRLYSDTACTALLLDSGVVLCSEGAGGKVAGLTAVQSASAYAWGGGTSATCWVTSTANVRGVKIDVVDTANLPGYLEATRIILGDYFQPLFNAEMGASTMWDDTTTTYRTDAGNLLPDVGTKFKKVSLILSFMQPADRAGLWRLVNYCGKSQPIFLSVLCGHPDKELEQSLTVYGYFTQMSTIACRDYLVYSAPMEVESL